MTMIKLYDLTPAFHHRVNYILNKRFEAFSLKP